MSLRLNQLLDCLDDEDLDTINHRQTATPQTEQAYVADLVNEELAELIQANVKHFVRHKVGALDKVCEEAADVILMMDQLVRLLPPERVQFYLLAKTQRTIERYHTADSTYDDRAQL